MIKKILIANRGEIAIRVLRAASELKIRTVAVYTYEDRYSLHRYKADEAYQIGLDNEPLKPYLDIDGIIHLAKKQKVDAIHPGYGFLAENVEFARKCKEEGIIYVGPSPDVMEQLGNKTKAKLVAEAVGVPIIKSNLNPLKNAATAAKEADKLGYPVILKAAAGGGGRGMRIIRSRDDISATFNEASREALNAFGDDTLFLEMYIDNPKHIEVQILGDQHGNIVHLFERDCSVQRRFQKVVEIAPAPLIASETKQKLYEYALRIARHVNYTNAGTVEFLVDAQENIYFIEVNPRIQVEHTVTEAVTGIDIVGSQIIIASGKPLSAPGIYISKQEDVKCNGFALQCRITTEDPENNFKPDYGRILAYRNAGGFGIRIDEGSSYSGVRISPFFDSMLAKVTASGRTLQGACQRLYRTLIEFRIRGVKTNIPFLENVLEHPTFREGKATVRFIDDHPELFKYTRKLDRGTKLLRYIGNVTVNGNADVKIIDPGKTFNQPVVPAFDRYAEFPAGTKQKLQELGPDKFVQWIKADNKVHYTDTTMRDAHQSLIATRVRTLDMMLVAEAFAKAHPQVFSMEVWGGATFDVSLRFLKECPWKRLELLRAAMPNILLQMLLRGSNAVGYTAYPDNLVQLFIEKAAETGIDIFRIFDSLNWIENMKVSIKTVRERTTSLAEACICYTGDILDPQRQKYSLKYYLDLARQLEDAGAHIIAIKDMAGLLKPYSAELLVTELKKTVDLPIHLHTHDTSAAQLGTYLKAVEAGVDIIDVALGSMSGLTSQPNFNTMVEILRFTDRHREFDISSLNEFSNYWADVREFYYPFESGLKSGTAEVYEHEIPGGQYSNLGPQANALGLGDKMNEIKRTYKQVNTLFGDIVKVTPSSKVVGDLAMYLVSNSLTTEDLAEKGDTISFPESVKNFFRGDLGQPFGGFPADIQRMVLKDEKPFTERPNAHLDPIDFEKEYEELKENFDRSLSLLDFISFKLYPKVFRDYFNHLQLYGDTSRIPTAPFFYGMKNNDETLIEIDDGKTIMVQQIYVSEPTDEAIRTVHFKLNGQSRSIEIKDLSVKVERASNAKATESNEIGAPLQGMLSRILVKKDQKVKPNMPLFVIEAMKMETTITSTESGVVDLIALKEGTLVDVDDLVIRLSI